MSTMTKERIKQLLPVITAFAEDRPIEVRFAEGATTATTNPWLTYYGNTPDFQNTNWEWRVKAVPKEWWVVFLGDSVKGFFCDSKAVAEDAAKTVSSVKIIHVREVIDE